MLSAYRLIVLTCFTVAAQPTFAIDTERADVQAFIAQMTEKHGYDAETLATALQAADSKQSIIDAISRPAERTLTWGEYRNIFLTEERIEAGATFWQENQTDLDRISKDSGVSPEILVAIIGVETYFGRITGNYRVLDALATLAFDYPPRSKFFTSELEQFLLLVREEGIDAQEPTGSYAGAMGRPQFMPSSYRAYAVDASDDGQRDIWENWQDVIGSVANYFVEHGWQTGNEVAAQATLSDRWQGEVPDNTLRPKETVAGLSEQGVVFATDMPADHTSQLLSLEGAEGVERWVGFHNFFVITRYNRSVMYALAVHQLGQEIASQVAEQATSVADSL